MSENQDPKHSDEKTLVSRISNLKLINILLILFFVGIGLFAIRIALEFAKETVLQQVFRMITEWLAGALLSTVLIGFAYEWFIRNETKRESELLLEQNFNVQNKALANTIILEVPKTILLNQEIQSNVFAGNNQLLDSALRNFLRLRLGDSLMGDGLFDGLLSKTLSYPERYVDYRNEIILTSITDEKYLPEVKVRFFDLTLNIKYRTKLLTNEIRFARVFDINQYNARVRDLRYRYTFMFPRSDIFPESDMVLSVPSFKIDGVELKVREEAVGDAYELIVDDPLLAKKIDQEVTIQYIINSKTHRYGHSFNVNIIKPTLNALFIFNYSKSDIAHATAYDFFISSKLPTIYKTPEQSPQMIVVELDEWTFPKGGVVFAWTLQEDKEIIDSFKKKTDSPPEKIDSNVVVQDKNSSTPNETKND